MQPLTDVQVHKDEFEDARWYQVTMTVFNSALCIAAAAASYLLWNDDERGLAVLAAVCLVVQLVASPSFLPHIASIAAAVSVGLLIHGLERSTSLAVVLGVGGYLFPVMVTLIHNRIYGSPPTFQEVQDREKARSQLENAATELQLARSMEALDKRLNDISSVEYFGAWLERYEQLRVLNVDDATFQIGELLFQLGEFKGLVERVPEDIAAGMPHNVKQDVVRKHYYQPAHYNFESEVRDLMAMLQQVENFKISSGMSDLEAVHVGAVRFSALHLQMMVIQAAGAIALWNGNPRAAGKHLDRTTAKEKVYMSALNSLEIALGRLAEQNQEQFQQLGVPDFIFSNFGVVVSASE